MDGWAAVWPPCGAPCGAPTVEIAFPTNVCVPTKRLRPNKRLRPIAANVCWTAAVRGMRPEGPEGRRRAKMVQNGRYTTFYKNIDEKLKYTLKNTENSKKLLKISFHMLNFFFLGLLQDIKRIILRVPGPLKRLNYGLKSRKTNN